MRATGIIRRIDDLGRVVIPKEIRKSLFIREGDPLEVYLENGAICFMPYRTDYTSELQNLRSVLAEYCETENRDKWFEALKKLDEAIIAMKKFEERG